MSPDKSKQLIEIYPEIFSDLHPMTAVPIFGIECGDGWFDLLKDLITEVKVLSLEGLKVHQIKEKYGTLRFYTNWDNDELSALVDKAEERSAITCETCGKPGGIKGDRYWVYVACEGCAE